MIEIYYKLEGLEGGKSANIIYKEVSAVHGIEDITIDLQNQRMAIRMEEEAAPRIEYAVRVIIGCISPGIRVEKMGLD